MTPAAVQQLLNKYISEELSKEEFEALWQTLSEDEHLDLWEQQADALLQSGGFEELAHPAKPSCRKKYGRRRCAGFLPEKYGGPLLR
jgi:hypothetical protein